MGDKQAFDVMKHIREQSYFDKKQNRQIVKRILDTAPRVAWFRSDFPIDSGWRFLTTKVVDDENGCEYEANIIDPNGATVVNAHRFVARTSFENYREKAETQAVGRALALAGYGTIFALDKSEDDGEGDSDHADAPVTTAIPPTTPTEPTTTNNDPRVAVAQAVRQSLLKKAEAFKRTVDEGTLGKMRGLMDGTLNRMAVHPADFNAETKVRAEQLRHSFLKYVWGVESSNDMKAPAIGTTLDWLALDKVDTPEGKKSYQWSETTFHVKENFDAVIAAALLESGQKELGL